MIRAQPMDAVVLVGGCDKTVPAQLMGAASADVPAIQLVTGPMMTGPYRGERLGACTDCRRFWARFRAGEIGRAGDRRRRGPPRHHRRHLRRDGHGQHHGLDRRGARHDAAGHRGHPRRPCRPAARRRGERAPRRWRWRKPKLTPDRDHHRRNRSRTRCACCWRSAARPMPSSISPPSPAASASTFRCERLNALSRRDAGAGRSQADRASTTWRICSPPAASARCCAS